MKEMRRETERGLSECVMAFHRDCDELARCGRGLFRSLPHAALRLCSEEGRWRGSMESNFRIPAMKATIRALQTLASLSTEREGYWGLGNGVVLAECILRPLATASKSTQTYPILGPVKNLVYQVNKSLAECGS